MNISKWYLICGLLVFLIEFEEFHSFVFKKGKFLNCLGNFKGIFNKALHTFWNK